MSDGATFIALVWAWMAENPEYYCSWVCPHRQFRWSHREGRLLATHVGGHWRRLACWARVVPALNCVCHFERLVKPRYMGPPALAIRERRNPSGEFIPRRYRMLIWAP